MNTIRRRVAAAALAVIAVLAASGCAQLAGEGSDQTYTIAGERGSGVIGINGAAARLVHPGDLVILIAYGQMDDAEARAFQPGVVFVDAENQIIGTGADPAEALPESGLTRGDVVFS